MRTGYAGIDFLCAVVAVIAWWMEISLGGRRSPEAYLVGLGGIAAHRALNFACQSAGGVAGVVGTGVAGEGRGLGV